MNTAAGVLFVRDGGRKVLMVEPSYKGHWDLPGGQVERGESPKAAAARELKEELGLTAEVGRLLVIDYLPPNAHRDEMTAYVFDGGSISDNAITVDGDEILSWAWVGLDRSNRTVSAPILERRIQHAIMAWRHGTTLYLESGWMQ